jgi:hypothetical protein
MAVLLVGHASCRVFEYLRCGTDDNAAGACLSSVLGSKVKLLPFSHCNRRVLGRLCCAAHGWTGEITKIIGEAFTFW